MYPLNKWIPIGGFGIYWPGRVASEEQQDGSGKLMYQSENPDGSTQWNSLPGQRCDSTRVELAAAIIAMMRSNTIHIVTDSAAMMTKALKLIEDAKEWCSTSQPEWLPKEHHIKKHGGFNMTGTCGKFSLKQSW